MDNNLLNMLCFRICKICKIKPDRYLILLASSYVLIVFGTKTFTNSLELPLVSLLLWKVVDSMVKSEKVSKKILSYFSFFFFNLIITYNFEL